MAQNPKNRVQKSLFSIFSFFPVSKSNFFGCILSHTVHIWSVPIFSPDFDIQGSKSPKQGPKMQIFTLFSQKKNYVCSKSIFFWYILSNMVQIWSVPIFSPDVDLHGSKSPKQCFWGFSAYFGNFEPYRSKSGLKIGTDHI